MISPVVDTDVRWRFHSTCPPNWPVRLEQCGAGFFHSPPGLVASAAGGEAFFAELVDGDDVVGIAAGVQRRCRVPPRPRHAYVPTSPALVAGAEHLRPRVVELLELDAREAGWTDLIVDSFDGDGVLGPGASGIRLPMRNEYAIDLAGDADGLRRALATHHRRRLPDDEGSWTLRTQSGPEARALLVEVTGAAARRAEARRGSGYSVTLPPAAAFREDPAWGLTTYAAMQGDELLSAALVGWAGRRAYYVSGGSTAAGYARDASVWLHLQIAQAFQAAGFTHYSLGGTPAGAVDPADPAHGLHRFKTGFGTRARPCAGVRWVFGAEHEAAHRFTRWLKDHLSGTRSAAC